MRRLLLGLLGANGDCLYGTILARQLRHDYPDAHITWAISSQCVSHLRNNPDIDDVWEIPIPGWEHHEAMWRVFEGEVSRRLLRHELDNAWLPQIWPNNFQNYDGTIRSSILRSYDRPITVPIENVIRLTGEEIERADRWASQAGIAAFEHRILFECTAKSGQSHMTVELAQEIAGHVYAALPSTTMMFSTHLPMELQHPNSRYAGSLSMRECARLTHHATMFVGAGSGGTVVATSTAANPLPMIQVLAAGTSVYASLLHDFEHFGLDASRILETTEESAKALAAAIVSACRDGIQAAKARHERRAPLHFEHYFNSIDLFLLRKSRYIDASQSLSITAERYGWRPELVDFGLKRIAPMLPADPAWVFASRRRTAELFMDVMAGRRRSYHPRQPAGDETDTRSNFE